jgi:class 3 adenylate cyclase
MDLKPIVLLLADISGYTRFIRLHRVSLVHAERIVAELLESVIASTGLPLVLHELEGDAVTFYAVDDGPESCAGDVFTQARPIVESFRAREAELISECSLCACDACKNVGQLRIKMVLHRGDAVIGSLRQFTKVAGEDVILAHRLLKNSIPSDEYVLMTQAFLDACPGVTTSDLERRVEVVEGLGAVDVHVLDLQRTEEVVGVPRPLSRRLGMFATIDGYWISRFFRGRPRRYRNLPEARS